MTNAEAAKWFASLPPEKDAEILVLDADSGVINEDSLVAFGEHHLDDLDEGEEHPEVKGQPTLYQKW